MNSLNILSARVIRQSPSGKSATNRPRSYSDGSLQKADAASKPKRSASQHIKRKPTADEARRQEGNVEGNDEQAHVIATTISPTSSEKSHILFDKPSTPRHGKLRIAAKRLVNVLASSFEWVLSSLAFPGVFLMSAFYDSKGNFSPFIPMQKLRKFFLKRNGINSTAQAVGLTGSSNDPIDSSSIESNIRKASRDLKHSTRSLESFPSATSDLELDAGTSTVLLNSPPESRPKIQTSSSSEEVPPARRSIRIKLYNEDSTRRRKPRRAKDSSRLNAASTSVDKQPPLTVANIKSPTSPTSSLKLTRYPRNSAPPRPLIPRRQPSYSSHSPRSSRLAQKTLVIDLDETLIHSLAKGGRMSSGHMVEVKLQTAVGFGGATLGPQHPILYYVHKRPHCDDFLRKVYKWYNLVVFTASVQEYADPVIDWLEQERKCFSRRYYRQHCTFRNGAYIKDLSSVEPDLSKVMILDNSPLSYIFHEDNAIPIEGWINDPTDNDLLHLIPLLEALQYVTDVRALLALRRGEVDAS